MAQLSANEQYLLELINAARTEIGAQPLASNTLLDQAAEDHSEWMINTDIFSHSGAGGSDPGTRMTAAGYTFGGSSWTWGENIAWASTRAPDGYQDEVRLLHTDLMNSPGHRENLLNGDFKEVGLGIEIGEYQGWQGAFVTEDFAQSGTGSFLTGVAYSNTNGNRFYDPGEGLGGITVDAVDSAGAHFTTTTTDAGGYNLKLAPGTYSVTFRSEGGATLAQSITIGASNVKVDAADPTFAPDEKAAPVATINDHTATASQWQQVQSWINYTDPNGDTAIRYEFWDSGAGAGSGYFWTPSNSHWDANTTIPVEAADLGNVWVSGGQTAGSETMWVRAFDGANWSDWDSFFLITA
jgi:Cysteine-rich secretory protein family/Carboxypeptidase regulatory-like domain